MKAIQNIYKLKRIFYRVTTIVIAIAYMATGIGNILPISHIAQEMAHLGYPAYFLKILGGWKMLASIIILIPGIPRIKEWVFAGMIFDLTGAALSRYFSGDTLQMIIIPIVIAGLVTINYILRQSMFNRVNY